jgi:hypothetical protein
MNITTRNCFWWPRVTCGLNAKGGQGCPVGAYVVQVDCCRNDLHILGIKLLSLCQNVSIAHNHGTSVIIGASSIAPSLVGVEIYASALACCAHNEFQAGVKLAKLMVRPRSIPNNVNATKRHLDMRTLRSPQFLTGLASDCGTIATLQKVRPKWSLGLSELFRKPNGKKKCLIASRWSIGSEVSRLAVVFSVCHGNLGSNQ